VTIQTQRSHAEVEADARADAFKFVDALGLCSTDRDKLTCLIEEYAGSRQARAESDVESQLDQARDEGYEDGERDGKDEGRHEALEAFSNAGAGSARIRVLETIRRHESDAACPYEMKTWSALADAMEGV